MPKINQSVLVVPSRSVFGLRSSSRLCHDNLVDSQNRQHAFAGQLNCIQLASITVVHLQLLGLGQLSLEDVHSHLAPLAVFVHQLGQVQVAVQSTVVQQYFPEAFKGLSEFQAPVLLQSLQGL